MALLDVRPDRVVAPARRTVVGITVFWVGLSVAGDGVTTLVLPRSVLDLAGEHRQATIVGLVGFLGIVAGLVVQPLAGAASDRLRARWGRRGFLLGGCALIVAALGAYGAAGSIATVGVAFVALQAAASVAQAPQQALLPDLVPARRHGACAGWKGAADVGGAFVAFALLAPLLAHGSVDLALVAVALLVVATAVAAVTLVREPAVPVAPRTIAPQRFRPREHPAFTRTVVARFLFLLATFGVGRFFVLYVADRLGVDADTAVEQAGWLLAALALATAAGSPYAGRLADRYGAPRVMVAGAVTGAVGVLLLVPARSPLAMLGGGLVMSAGSAAFATANWAHTARLAPPEAAGRFLGIANVGTAGAAAMAGAFGPLIDSAGFAALFVAAAVAYTAAALVARPLRALREEPA